MFRKMLSVQGRHLNPCDAEMCSFGRPRDKNSELGITAQQEPIPAFRADDDRRATQGKVPRLYNKPL